MRDGREEKRREEKRREEKRREEGDKIHLNERKVKAGERGAKKRKSKEGELRRGAVGKESGAKIVCVYRTHTLQRHHQFSDF